MALEWTADQVKIYNLLTVEGKTHKEIVALGFDKGLISKVKRAIDAGEAPPEKKTTAAVAPKPKILGEEGEEILAQVAGFGVETEALLFIFDPLTKKIRQFRHKFPQAVPMYLDCLKPPINFVGSFDEWLYAMARTVLKAFGWEYKMTPISHGLIFSDVERLVEEGKLAICYDPNTGNPKLEVINDNGRGGEEPGGPDDGGKGEGEAENKGADGKHADGGPESATTKNRPRGPRARKGKSAASK